MKMEEQTSKKSFVPKGQMLKDAASLNLLDRVEVRVKRRLQELKDISQAKHRKEQRGNTVIWHTFQPDMHISNLSASVINGVGTIEYDVYKMDKDGNKDREVIEQEMPNSGKKLTTSCDFIIEKKVVETIEFRKPLKAEEYK